MEERHRRQSTLLELLASRPLSTQGEVVSAMVASGFDLTQPSISRDFRELGIAKVGGRYQQLAEQVGLAPVTSFPPLLISVEVAGPHMIVLRTSPGGANAVAAAVDAEALPGVVGTVAGDDTIFLALRSRAAQRRAVQWLRQRIRKGSKK